ncbi:uncharacterized protein LOC124265003 [Haliotis rubra]|uniref:uncharacterized protein LOC124265003 n=1 Tax=Haliotis rubra TaxID=36100 RepID=UPI001EE5F641|nr:uncharacterized protein LOC124265003 [Haliotis rubra]
MSTDGVRTGNRCIEDLTKVFTVQLQCSVDERIHVVHEVYGDGDVATCCVKSAGSCSTKLDSSQHGLVVNCNGKQSCREAMQVPYINNCNITDAAAEVKYNCIKGSMNMCSPVTTTVNGSVYLHSPGFPDSVGVNSSCVVRITGQTLQVTLLQWRMRSGDLDISGDGRQLWTNVNVFQHNRVLPGTAAEIVIVFDNHDQSGENVWIRVADSGQMTITITGVILYASTTATSTHQPLRSQSTFNPSTSDTAATETTTRAQSTAIASFTTVTSTRGPTTHSTGSKQGHSSETSSVQSSHDTASFTTTKSTPGLTTPSPGSKRTQRTTKATTIVSTFLTTRWVVSLAVPCAVSCVVFAIITIILCRYRQKRQTRSQDTSTDRPLELATSGSAEPSNLYFVKASQPSLVPAFINLNNEEVPDAEASSKLTDTRPEHERYSKVLPRHLRFNQNDKARISGNRAEMVDNFLYSTSKHELIDERADDAILENMDTCLVDDGNIGAGVCYMTENDIYCGDLLQLTPPLKRAQKAEICPKKYVSWLTMTSTVEESPILLM